MLIIYCFQHFQGYVSDNLCFMVINYYYRAYRKYDKWMKEQGYEWQHQPGDGRLLVIVQTTEQADVAIKILMECNCQFMFFIDFEGGNGDWHTQRIHGGDLAKVRAIGTEVNKPGYKGPKDKEYWDIMPEHQNWERPCTQLRCAQFFNTAGTCVMVDIWTLNGEMPEPFAELLANPKIIKVQWGQEYEEIMLRNGTNFYKLGYEVRSYINWQAVVGEYVFEMNAGYLMSMTPDPNVRFMETPQWRIPTADGRERSYQGALEETPGLATSAYTALDIDLFWSKQLFQLWGTKTHRSLGAIKEGENLQFLKYCVTDCAMLHDLMVAILIRHHVKLCREGRFTGEDLYGVFLDACEGNLGIKLNRDEAMARLRDDVQYGSMERLWPLLEEYNRVSCRYAIEAQPVPAVFNPFLVKFINNPTPRYDHNGRPRDTLMMHIHPLKTDWKQMEEMARIVYMRAHHQSPSRRDPRIKNLPGPLPAILTPEEILRLKNPPPPKKMSGESGSNSTEALSRQAVQKAIDEGRKMNCYVNFKDPYTGLGLDPSQRALLIRRKYQKWIAYCKEKWYKINAPKVDLKDWNHPDLTDLMPDRWPDMPASTQAPAFVK